MPVTRARTSTSREPAIWPTYSKAAGTDCACTATTATSGGTRPCGCDAACSQPLSKAETIAIDAAAAAGKENSLIFMVFQSSYVCTVSSRLDRLRVAMAEPPENRRADQGARQQENRGQVEAVLEKEAESGHGRSPPEPKPGLLTMLCQESCRVARIRAQAFPIALLRTPWRS